jgi:hypothetical protein
MENKKIVVNTELDMIQYVNCVNKIASKFLSDEFEYEPHIGMLHAMCLFYNLCVKDSKYKNTVGEEIHDIWDIRDVAKDPEFIREFNNAIRGQETFSLNFSNAYRQAMDIVETKKNPVNNIINLIKDFGVGLSSTMGELLNIGGISMPEAEENQVIPNEEATTEV